MRVRPPQAISSVRNRLYIAYDAVFLCVGHRGLAKVIHFDSLIRWRLRFSKALKTMAILFFPDEPSLKSAPFSHFSGRSILGEHVPWWQIAIWTQANLILISNSKMISYNVSFHTLESTSPKGASSTLSLGGGITIITSYASFKYSHGKCRKISVFASKSSIKIRVRVMCWENSETILYF